MSHSHLIVGHVTDNSVKVWVRAGDDVNFIAPADINIDVIDKATNQIVYRGSHRLADDSTYGCHVFEVQDLNQQGEDFKSYSINRSSIESSTISTIPPYVTIVAFGRDFIGLSLTKGYVSLDI